MERSKRSHGVLRARLRLAGVAEPAAQRAPLLLVGHHGHELGRHGLRRRVPPAVLAVDHEVDEGVRVHVGRDVALLEAGRGLAELGELGRLRAAERVDQRADERALAALARGLGLLGGLFLGRDRRLERGRVGRRLV